MIRRTISIALGCVLFALCAFPALAADTLYPASAEESLGEDGARSMVKTYELSPGENPDGIPRNSFERNGYTYELTDITRRETTKTETREHVETVTIETDTKDTDAITDCAKSRYYTCKI